MGTCAYILRYAPPHQVKSQPARGLSLRSGTVDRVSDDSIFQNLSVASISSILR